MSLFRFNDNRSQKQIGTYIKTRNGIVDQQNADNLANYYAKRAQLSDSREQWEVDEVSLAT